MSGKKRDIFSRYPNWLIEDIKKMAKRVGKDAYSLVVAKYKIPLEELKEILNESMV